ncbi:oligosaccharide flippase family protein [Terrimonas sp. NA20]|uniref:Oligosaccharide flippase family protein n=1 Tax=Terrimonas ginsenosidimutans TaxID=2908004 RepID=A0ABS9KUW1_9BACT|nr:oligosaccharide flippase family protein [Terrimonas ginsenosidimutans]MCG2616078.1 oligosaccharide flippase family protein [Terrimonas ginsenosidimutans]
MSLVIRIASITKKYGTNFIANIFQQCLRFIIMYMAAKQLGPKEFGIVSLLIMISSYLMNANFGAVNGLKRQIPVSYSRQGENVARDAFYSVFNFNIVSTLVVSLVVAGILLLRTDYDIFTCAVLVLLSLSVNVYFSVQTYFTATASWKDLFKLQLTCGLLLVGALVSLFFSDYLILLLAYSGAFLFASLRFFLKAPVRFSFDSQIVRDNIYIGFPIMIAGLIYFLFQTTDRLIISRYYLKEEFGFYSFAWLLAMSLNLIVSLASELILQRAASRYAGEFYNNQIFRFLLRYSLLVQAGLVILAAILITGAYYVLPVYLTDYVAALPVIRNILIAYVIQQLGLTAGNYYLIVGRQRVYNILLVIACVLNAGLLLGIIFFSRIRPSIEQMSSFYIISSVLYIIVLYIPLRKQLFSK